MTPGDFAQSLPEMEEWGGTGIIARVETPQVAKAILATRLLVVAMDLSEAQLAPGSRSIHEEIQRTRLERAKQLLLETDLPLPKVARACGFRSPSYLAAVFRRHLGVTPIKYRANNRSRSP